jgi:hypothetical protein
MLSYLYVLVASKMAIQFNPMWLHILLQFILTHILENVLLLLLLLPSSSSSSSLGSGMFIWRTYCFYIYGNFVVVVFVFLEYMPYITSKFQPVVIFCNLRQTKKQHNSYTTHRRIPTYVQRTLNIMFTYFSFPSLRITKKPTRHYQ